jgi:hypothetical protein
MSLSDHDDLSQGEIIRKDKTRRGAGSLKRMHLCDELHRPMFEDGVET